MLLSMVKEDGIRLECSFPGDADVSRQFPVEIDVCPDPLCDCSKLQLEIHTEDLFDNQDRHKLTLDLASRAVVTDDDSHESPLCARFMELIDEEDWELLVRFYLSFKATCTHEADLDAIEPVFPIFDIERQSVLIRYGQVLPFEPYSIIDLHGHQYTVVDMYCVNRSCHCKLVHLAIDLQEENGGEKDGLLLAVDLNTGQYQLEKCGEMAGELKLHDVMAKVWEVTDLDTYRIRYKRMRKWYQAYYDRHGGDFRKFVDSLTLEPITVAAQQVGRNDPCPCGSGRKYKKCCLQ